MYHYWIDINLFGRQCNYCVSFGLHRIRDHWYFEAVVRVDSKTIRSGVQEVLSKFWGLLS
jgi:hypothetical protein